MKTLAFIPARGGSKRLPGKNIKHFGGVPLIAYSIYFALYNQFSKVVVSTDDNEIASVAEKFGAEVLMRPAELSTDTAKTSTAAMHCLQSQRMKGFVPDVFVTLQPTNPLRPKDLFQRALVEFSNCDSVISVSSDHHKFGSIKEGLFEPDYLVGSRSQDLSPRYFENGLIYLSNPFIVVRDDIFGKRIKPIVTIENYPIVDIDTASDFAVGECILDTFKSDFNYLLNQ